MMHEAPGSLCCFSIDAKRYCPNDGIGRIVTKFRIATQFVDRTRLRNLPGTISVFPVLRREGQNLGGLLHGFVDGVTDGDKLPANPETRRRDSYRRPCV
jgi:hypothetical protein